MFAAASWVLLTGVHHHRVDVFVLPTAELASECSRDVAVERFVVAAVRVVHACVQKKRPQVCVLPSAVDAVERSAGVALEQGVIALVGAVRMMIAGVPEKRSRIPIRLAAVFTVLAHILHTFRLSACIVPYCDCTVFKPSCLLMKRSAYEPCRRCR